jgi:hypothetical protein
MASADELRAALKVAELEEQLLAAKKTKRGPSDELKLELRAARRAHREMREARPAEEGEARPAAVKATAEAKL